MDASEVMKRVCEAGAAAVRRYVDVSGEAPTTMPEHFIASIIFDRLGDEFTSTMETSARTLVRWHDDGHPGVAQARAENWKEEMKGWRVDLVIFESNGRSKYEMPIFALVEIKKGWSSDELNTGARSDLDKLAILLKHLDICKYAAMAAWLPGQERDKKRQRAISRGDIWFEAAIELPEISHRITASAYGCLSEGKVL